MGIAGSRSRKGLPEELISERQPGPAPCADDKTNERHTEKKNDPGATCEIEFKIEAEAGLKRVSN
jgi:hypothetical protein